MLYSETKITKRQNNWQQQLPDNSNNPQLQPTKEELGRKEILNYIKTNNNYRGPFSKNRVIRTIVYKSTLCKFCLTNKCRKEQIKGRKPPNCKKIPYDISYSELIKLLENDVTTNPTEILSNSTIYRKPSQENKTPTTPEKEQNKAPTLQDTDIKPEERFEEIPNDNSSVEIPDEEPTDMDEFVQLMKEMGIPTLKERGATNTIATTSIIKQNYLMEP